MAKDFKSVMEGPSEEPVEEPMEEESSYDAFTSELKEILGLDDEKAQRLRDAICGLAREEMSMEDEGEESPPSEKPKKKGLAVVIGG
jgi:hypothetical protein